ncbi:MAG: Uma2 family endonuclease [Cyclobacteriaceae bacterium]|jgi:Uma2 family endonuclease
MNNLGERLPRTIMEVYKMLPEGTLAEIINGEIYVNQPRLRNHQRMVGKLICALYSFLEISQIGEVYLGPLDVYLDEEANAVQPDIIFVRKANLAIVKDHIHGVPDLVVEVLSGSNRSHDLKTKKELYEKFQLSEYWVIDPDSNEAIIFIYENGSYKQLPSTHGSVSSPMFKHTFTF